MASKTGRIAPPGYPTRIGHVISICVRRGRAGGGKHTDVLDTLAQHHLVEDLATSLANEPIHISALCIRSTTKGRGNSLVRLVHLLPPGVNQGLDMLAVGALEGRARNIADFPI